MGKLLLKMTQIHAHDIQSKQKKKKKETWITAYLMTELLQSLDCKSNLINTPLYSGRLICDVTGHLTSNPQLREHLY